MSGGGFDLLVLLAVQNPIAVSAIPFRLGISDNRLRDQWVVAALVPALVASVAEDNNITNGTMSTETVFAEGQLLATAVDTTFDLRVCLGDIGRRVGGLYFRSFRGWTGAFIRVDGD